MKAMILAAGRGERMRPLTDSIPKPLVEVDGTPLIERHIAALRDAGIVDIVINLGWLGSVLRDRLGDGSRLGVRIAWSEEGWPALETGGGVRQALPLLGDAPFLLVSGDIWTDFPLVELRARAERMPTGDVAHLVLVPNPPYHSAGDFSLDDGRICNAPRELTFANLSILRPALFDGTSEGAFPIVGLWRAAADAGQVTGERYDGRWWNLGTPAQLREIELLLHPNPSSPPRTQIAL